MAFLSLEFFVFLPVVIGINYILKGKYRLFFLSIVSIYYYLTFASKYSFAILIIVIFSYIISLFISSVKKHLVRKLLLFSGLIFIIGILFYFKYFGFFVENLESLGIKLSIKTAPPFFFFGISYIAFQIIAYFLDLYYDRVPVEKNIIAYSVFILFFPKIISGPIERATGFLQELKKTPELNHENIYEGIKFFIWGLFSKVVIADRLSYAVANVFSKPFDYNGLAVLTGVLFFTIQLYTDFMGYSYMALGVSKMLGYNLINNFRIPFFSQSIGEFWRRWHISLSSWLRDYLFLPLSYFISGKMRKISGLTRRTDTIVYVLSTFITMTICGIWHGAGWTFIIWGALHGIYMISSFLSRKLRKNVLIKSGLKNSTLSVKTARMILNFMLVAFAFIFFRSETLSDSFKVISSIFGNGAAGIGTLFHNTNDLIISCLAIISLLLAEFIQFRNNDKKISQIINLYIIFGLILIITLFGKFGESDFIYFKF